MYETRIWNFNIFSLKIDILQLDKGQRFLTNRFNMGVLQNCRFKNVLITILKKIKTGRLMPLVKKIKTGRLMPLVGRPNATLEDLGYEK